MTLKGRIDSEPWSVEAVTSPAREGGFLCHIHVTHQASSQPFSRSFRHHRVFESEQDAVLQGLREGIVWVDLKLSHAFEA